MMIDPLADYPSQFTQSPYQFSWNNPILLSDPSGLHPTDTTIVEENNSGTALGFVGIISLDIVNKPAPPVKPPPPRVGPLVRGVGWILFLLTLQGDTESWEVREKREFDWLSRKNYKDLSGDEMFRLRELQNRWIFNKNGDVVRLQGREITDSGGNVRFRALVENYQDLKEWANIFVGRSIDDMEEDKPNHWIVTLPNGTLRKVEYQPGGESNTNEGPHVKVQEWNRFKGKLRNGTPVGKWDTVYKIFVIDHERYRREYKKRN